MPCRIKNSMGTISIDNEVVARIAGLAAMECYGVVGMATKNVKDGLVHLLKMESLTRGIKLKNENEVVNIDLHIIAEYGTNIAAVSESLMTAVKYKLGDMTGINVGQVNVFVEGLRVNGK